MSVSFDGPPALGTPILSTTSGLRRTAVHQIAADRYVWHLVPGDRAPAPLRHPDPTLTPLIAAASTSELTFVPAEPHGDGLLHRTSAALSAAYFMGAAPPIRRQLLPDLSAVARGLARLHRNVMSHPAEPSPAVTRLLRWTNGADVEPGAERLRVLASDRWGRPGMDLLRSWAEQSCGGTGRLLHGNASLGSLLPLAPPVSGFELLTGTDLTSGHPEFDYGWMLGELFELAFAADGRRPDRAPMLDDFARSLLHDDLDPALVGRAMVLRVAAHMHDFAAYMPWQEHLTDYIDLVRLLLDSEPGDLLAGAAR
jgi:hypothetical protein